MVKRACLIVFILTLLSFNYYSFSQSPDSTGLTNKTVNWGVSVGINALAPRFCSISQDETPASNISVKNEVSYLASAFVRINLSNFFMQPELSFHKLKEGISFTVPVAGSTTLIQQVDINPVYYSVDVPVLLGYNIIKEGSYLLSVFSGPVFKYNYKNTYQFPGGVSIEQLNTDLKFNDLLDTNIDIGMSANINHLYFDFRYEISLSETKIDFNQRPETPPSLKGIKIDKNENTLSFSCGLMF